MRSWRELSPAERTLQIDLLAEEGWQVSGDFDPQSPIAPSVRRGETLRSADPQPATAGPAPVSITVTRPNVLFGYIVAVMAVVIAHSRNAICGNVLHAALIPIVVKGSRRGALFRAQESHSTPPYPILGGPHATGAAAPPITKSVVFPT